MYHPFTQYNFVMIFQNFEQKFKMAVTDDELVSKIENAVQVSTRVASRKR